MLSCPNCHCKDVRITNTFTREVTWKGRKVLYIRRRKVCRYCKHSYYTVEAIEEEIEETFPEIEPPEMYT